MKYSMLVLSTVLLFENFSFGMANSSPDNPNKMREKTVISALNETDYDTWFRAEDVSEMQALINKGIDINRQNWIDYTAIMCASMSGHIPVVRFLLNEGAISDGALTCAARKGKEEVAKLLLENGSKATERGALSAAVIGGNINLVRLLLENGANPNDDGHRDTPLICAAGSWRWDIFELLLEYKADPQVRNRMGETVLEFANRAGCYGMVSSLIYDAQNKK